MLSHCGIGIMAPGTGSLPGSACCPLDAGHTGIMIDRLDRPIADFIDTKRPRPEHN